MKSTKAFKDTIHKYLDDRAKDDVLFSLVYKKENKNIDDCITYILNTVKDSGSNGFTDDEVYSMAVHYYDEDNIDAGKPVNMQVVVNHQVELTDEEINEAKQQAIKRAEEDQYKKVTKKMHVVKPASKEAIQTSLF